MRTEIDLDSAAAAGIIGEDQAIALRNFQAQRDGISQASSEKFEIFGGYSDVVAGIGMALILGAVSVFMQWFGHPMAHPLFLSSIAGMTSIATFKVTQRVTLRASPAVGLVLTSGYAFYSFVSVALIIAAIISTFSLHNHEDWYVIALTVPFHALLVWKHWRRFRFPPTFALVIAGYSYILLKGLENAARFEEFLQIDGLGVHSLVALAGVIIATGTLIAGIWWDLTDIRRETERSQVGFWLHCVAGGLMSRALFSSLTGETLIEGELILTGITFSQFPDVIAMVAGASVVSLLLDRRSLLIGCLLPTAGIFNGLARGELPAIAGMVLTGSVILVFSAKWNELRVALLSRLPRKIAAQLPRTSLTSEGQRPTRRHLELRQRRFGPTNR